ncbi:hypothetical protein A2442_02630 [Candidatus Campbellbacteria bacterium RIFOXYC2_FULL_35_25]|uniref:Transposase IS200-like domain-containing protein n=1 Tax=Candidatus Campbellbacteria bacterium RIFOXYC2_FULL_35_25 TaxID=1797582 RepID=A0A1F5EIH8_9BACT|nr:MAG: hypothetical protein A2442_02630 [Candidatus Campbellbacteria bacterium RIFOXYC2_FULL_35_25]
MRNVKFENGEYYHIYNRGTDKRNIFGDKGDIWRFIKGILIFNRKNPVGSIREELNGRRIDRDLVPVNYGDLIELSGELVEIICLCLNPNHYHLLIRQVSDGGISKFMHKLGSGYTTYFNEKNKRSGSLFQGTFKAVHVESNEQLLYVSGYINLNDRVHEIGGEDKALVFSSWSEYCGENKVLNMCKKDIILGQFDNINDYKKFAKEVAESARENKKMKREESTIDLLE